MISRAIELGRRVAASEFSRNAFAVATLSAGERVIALVQTIVLARALGITEYGVYGLLFGTMGLISSIAGLQLGLTATVFVARYRENDKPRTAAVISIVTRFSWAIAALLIVGAAPFTERIALALIGTDRYAVAVLLGVVFVASAILSGVQDGVAQGFELFRALSIVKLTVALLVLALVYPAAHLFGLTGVLATLLLGPLVKLASIALLIERRRKRLGIPARGEGVQSAPLVLNFALPSVVVSAIVGGVAWIGMLTLSRQASGFDAVAIANVALQWRGPILWLATALGGVAVPAFSRLSTEVGAASVLRKKLLGANFIFAVLACTLVAICGRYILDLYGNAFSQDTYAFCVIVASSAPMVMANVYLQQLVGTGRMWRQLLLHIPYFIVACVAFAVLVPTFGVLGFGIALMLGSCAMLVQCWFAERVSPTDRAEKPTSAV